MHAINLSGLRPTRGYTLIEVLVSVLIIGIISSLAMVDIGANDATTRLDRAAQAIVAAGRYARMQNMGHGQTSGTSFQPTDAYGLQFDTSANTIKVYHATWNSGTNAWSLPGTTMANSLLAGGSYVINLKTDPAYAGVTIAAVQMTGTADTSPNTSSPYYCQYRPFGDTFNAGSNGALITLSYGGKTCTITIPAVGDPQEN
jgi:prepilin-type N-terminal cleavage/methylation domain-containing protein